MLDRFISWFAVPIGVVICFGPAILLWLFEEYKSPGASGPEDEK